MSYLNPANNKRFEGGIFYKEFVVFSDLFFSVYIGNQFNEPNQH